MKFITLLFLLIISCSYGREISRPTPGVGSIDQILNRFESRIIGGNNANPGDFPHQVSLQFSIEPLVPLTHFCGGSILSEKYILTAAHCVDGVEEIKGQLLPGFELTFVVKAGKLNLRRTEDSEQVAFVEKYLRHEKWNMQSEIGPYDVALLKLKTPLRLNKRVASIRLPLKDSEPDGATVLSGWGSVTNHTRPDEQVMPKILQIVFMGIVPRDECNKAVEAVAAEEGIVVKDLVHETNICTGPIEGRISACSGDSGGPLIKKGKNGQPDELVGIVSWGMIPCARRGAPSVFVRVSCFNEWIETNMKRL